MTDCPEPKRWGLFLDDQLPAEQEANLALHLETCSRCVSVLEELTSKTHDHAQAPTVFPGDLGSDSEFGPLRYLLPKSETTAERASLESVADVPQIPGYLIERELGRGGMGIVYLARQTHLNRRVALKVILAGRHAAPEQVVRFLAEAQTCAALRCEGIVRIFDVGQHAGLPYYAMEFVDGPNLAERARRHSFSPREAAGLVERLARAMHASHLQGVIHRDLKPANVLLESSPTEGIPNAKITDFGLAKRFDQAGGLTHTTALLGTPDYMAPEQVEPGTHHIGPSVDIYALGAVLYFLLVGRPPFAAASALETLAKVRNVDPDSPSQLSRAVPRDLSIICLCCLEKDPARRYATALALAEDLKRYSRGEPIAARPVSELERLKKWAYRNPTITALSGLLLAVVFIALGLVSWQWYRAEQARGRETLRANDEARARREVQILSVNYALDKGIQECRAEKIEEGLQSFLRALELLPAGEPELESAIRTNLSAWYDRRCPVRQGVGQGTAVTSVAFSPDGKSILTGNSGNIMQHVTPAKVSLWDAEHVDRGAVWVVDHPAAVRTVAFDPVGGLFAAGGIDGTATIRDAQSGEPRFPPLQHPSGIRAVAFDPDGRRLATGGGNEIRFWNVETGELDRRFEISFETLCLVWSSDGLNIAVGGVAENSSDEAGIGRAVILEVAAGTVHQSMIHNDAVTSVALQPGGELLATGCRDGFVRFWSAKSNLPVGRTLPHSLSVNCLKFSDDGELLAVAAGEKNGNLRAGKGEVFVWDVGRRALVCRPQYDPISGQGQNMTALAFGAEDRRLAAVSENGRLWLWSLPRPSKPRLSFKFPERADILPSPDGRRLVLTELSPRLRGFRHQPSIVRLIDPADGRIVVSLPHPVSVKTRFSADSRRFITLSHTPEVAPGVHLWDAADGAELPLPSEFGPALRDVHFPSDGRTVLTVSANGDFRTWNFETLLPSDQPKSCLSADESVLAFNSAGTRLLVNGARGARLISLPNCTTIADLCSEQVECATFTKDEQILVMSGGTLRPQTQSFAAVDGRRIEPTPASPDRYVTVVHEGHGVFLLDRVRETSTQFADSVESPAGTRLPVRAQVAMHPSGAYVVSTEGGSSDHFQLWSLSGKPLGPPLPHALLYAARFLPGGDELVTSSFDGSIHVWTVPKPLAGSVEEIRTRFNEAR